MALSEHLSELRKRLIICIIALLAGMAAAFFYTVPIIEALKAMAASPASLNPAAIASTLSQSSGVSEAIEFVQLTPGEVLLASVKLSAYLGAIFASPIVLYQVLRFVMPGLKPSEQRRLLAVVLGGSVLFMSGVAFAYFLVIPSALAYLLDFGQSVAKTQMSIARYIDFCASLLVLTGILFELPLLLFFLSLTGLITSAQLLSQWRTAIVLIVLAAAVITPSQDPFTLIIVATAMGGLYFLSILPIRLAGK